MSWFYLLAAFVLGTIVGCLIAGYFKTHKSSSMLANSSEADDLADEPSLSEESTIEVGYHRQHP